MTHRTGYHVWVFGDCFWHRSYAAAVRRFYAARNYCLADRQIIEVATGERLLGRAA